MSIDLKQPPAPHLLYLHIQKTAGSTLHNIIGRQYRKNEVLNIYNMIRDKDMVRELSAEQRKNIRIAKGHFPFGLHEQFSEPCEYITMLRDPVERTISHFYHASEDPGHWYHKIINENKFTLMDVLERGTMPNLDNNMVRMLSGDNRVAFGSCTEKMLEKANYNLENYFSIIGIQSRFDEFMIEAADRFGWNRFLYYRKKRVGKTRPQRQQLDEKTYAAVRQYNQFDQRLYDLWAPRIEKHIAEKGTDFAARVERFKRKNALVNKYMGWWPYSLTP